MRESLGGKGGEGKGVGKRGGEGKFRGGQAPPKRFFLEPRLGPKSPKPHFGILNRHFKPNMRKIQIAISSDMCMRLTLNLTGSCGQQQEHRGWSRMVVKQFQDGGRLPF